MPITQDLKLTWYDTQNIHLCTMKDFFELLKEMNLNSNEIYISRNKKLLKSNKLF